jgi:hypothetical protein
MGIMDKLKEKREEAKRIRKGDIKEIETPKDEETMKLLTESHMERRHMDTGNLFVTNKRFVFVGNHKNIDFPLGKVLAVEPFSDGIGISRANKQKTEYFVGGFDGLTVKAAIEGAIRNL